MASCLAISHYPIRASSYVQLNNSGKLQTNRLMKISPTCNRDNTKFSEGELIGHAVVVGTEESISIGHAGRRK